MPWIVFLDRTSTDADIDADVNDNVDGDDCGDDGDEEDVGLSRSKLGSRLASSFLYRAP